MRATQRFLVALLFAVLGTAGVRAGYDESQAWFNALTLEQRTELQRDLILLGYYDRLVDGAFGEGTFAGLTAFQRALNSPATGVLADDGLERLHAEAGHVATRLGLSRIEDSAGQISLMLPAALLTQATAGDSGTIYTSEDGGLTLTTVRTTGSDAGFADLYAALSSTAKHRLISYSSFDQERFVVSGTREGRSFYLMYRNAGTEAVGYEMSWTQPYHRDAAIVSTYLASFAVPLVVPEEADTDGQATTLRRFGAFSLPVARPDAIQLGDEVGHDTDRDFERALAARPDATVLLLDSPGGYVDTALLIADRVHRRGMTTIVPDGSICFSACAYIFFAGVVRQADGDLGVHQISTRIADLVFAQTTLSDILDALDQYGVQQSVISHMLRTPPEKMYVFSHSEIVDWGINRGDLVQLASIEPGVPEDLAIAPRRAVAGAYVHLAQFSNRAEAERSLEAAKQRWSDILGSAVPVIDPLVRGNRTSYRVSVPSTSLESADALCAAIKSSGGGCYVTAI